MAIFRAQHNKNYTCVNNHICTDKRLSWKAKGVWLYAFSRPDDWVFHTCDLINQSTDGRDSVQEGLRELERAGYLVRSQIRKIDGKMGDADWIFHELPQSVQPIATTKKRAHNADEPLTDFPLTENPQLLSTDAQPNTETAKTVNDVNDCPPSRSGSLPFVSEDVSKKQVVPAMQRNEVTESMPSVSGGMEKGGVVHEKQKATERPQGSIVGSEEARRLAGIKQPLKREQIPLLEALTALDLGCDLATLYILIRTHEPQALQDAMHHLRNELARGQTIRNRIGFLRSILAGKISPVTELVAKNRALTEEKKLTLGWASIEIHEKFAFCTVTQTETPFSLPAEEFFNTMKRLYERGKSYEKKKSADTYDFGYDDGRDDIYDD